MMIYNTWRSIWLFKFKIYKFKNFKKQIDTLSNGKLTKFRVKSLRNCPTRLISICEFWKLKKKKGKNFPTEKLAKTPTFVRVSRETLE